MVPTAHHQVRPQAHHQAPAQVHLAQVKNLAKHGLSLLGSAIKTQTLSKIGLLILIHPLINNEKNLSGRDLRFYKGVLVNIIKIEGL